METYYKDQITQILGSREVLSGKVEALFQMGAGSEHTIPMHISAGNIDQIIEALQEAKIQFEKYAEWENNK